MQCQAKIYNNGKPRQDQCKREIRMGNFCVYHSNYIKVLEKEMAELQEELRRVESL